MDDKLKQEILSELDDFLLDNGVQKKKALKELDRLIQQDLSYNQILSSIKKNSLKNKQETVHHSSHVLDLRAKPNVEPEPVKIVPKPKKVRKIKFDFGGRLFVFAIIAAVILLPIRGLVLVGQIQDDKDRLLNFGRAGLIDLQSGVKAASENSYSQASVDFDQALYNFNQAESVLNNYHSWIVEIAKPLAISSNLLKVATNISEAASMLNQDILNQSNPTEYIYVINSQIKQTLPYLQAANDDLQDISGSSLPDSYQDYFASLKNYLPETLENLNHLQEIFTALENLLGHQTEKRYLVLFQNNNELRATGGFIASLAVFDVYQGKVTNLSIPQGGTYDLEAGQIVKYKAPQALSLINPYFNIWDANWWPDFQKSAKKIIWQYENALNSSSVDGAIAINAHVLQELLKVLGPIEMTEYNLTVTADNIFSVLQEGDKVLIVDLVPKVLDKLLKFENQQSAIVSIFAKMLSSKDIQIYAKDETLQNQMDNFGWAGKIYTNDRDYLYVVNTNIAGGKTDNDIYQTIEHQAEINQWGEIIDTVTITRTNRGQTDNPLAGYEGGNMSYVRIYVPEGSEFLEASGFDKLPESYFKSAEGYVQTDPDVAYDETNKIVDTTSNTEVYNSLGKTVFANWLGLLSGETKTVSVKYKLPFKLNLGDPLTTDWWQKLYKKDLHLDDYSLLVQSQSGNHHTIFNSAVFMPDNFKIIWNTSLDLDQMSVNNNLASYSADLDRDQYFGIILAGK